MMSTLKNNNENNQENIVPIQQKLKELIERKESTADKTGPEFEFLQELRGWMDKMGDNHTLPDELEEYKQLVNAFIGYENAAVVRKEVLPFDFQEQLDALAKQVKDAKDAYEAVAEDLLKAIHQDQIKEAKQETIDEYEARFQELKNWMEYTVGLLEGTKKKNLAKNKRMMTTLFSLGMELLKLEEDDDEEEYYHHDHHVQEESNHDDDSNDDDSDDSKNEDSKNSGDEDEDSIDSNEEDAQDE